MRHKNKGKTKKNVKINPNIKKEYILFMDETDANSSSEYFCLSGIIVKRSEYEDVIIEKVHKLKEKHFGNSNILFHYTEMKNNLKDFNVFKDAHIRNGFYVDFVNLLKSLDVTIISAYFHKERMANSYGKCALSDYDVAFRTILENFVHFLSNHNGDGMIIMESRLFNQNANLQKTFYQYINNGSELFSSRTIQYHLKCLGFIVKNENCIGLQIADFIPPTIIRIIKGNSDSFSMQKVIRSKVYKNGTEYENILGTRNILGNEDIMSPENK